MLHLLQTPKSTDDSLTQIDQPDAIAFAYEHFGRLVSDETPTRWLTMKADSVSKAGQAFKSYVGMVVYIDRQTVRVWHCSYRDLGIYSHGSSVEGRQFLRDLAIRPTAEPWIGIIRGQKGIHPSSLRLNMPGATETYVTDDGLTVVRRPALIRSIAERLRHVGGDDALDVLMDLYRLNAMPERARVMHAAKLGHDDDDRSDELQRLAWLIVRNGVSIKDVKACLEMAEDVR